MDVLRQLKDGNQFMTVTFFCFAISTHAAILISYFSITYITFKIYVPIYFSRFIPEGEAEATQIIF
jgi:hypothetical protein